MSTHDKQYRSEDISPPLYGGPHPLPQQQVQAPHHPHQAGDHEEQGEHHQQEADGGVRKASPLLPQVGQQVGGGGVGEEQSGGIGGVGGPAL